MFETSKSVLSLDEVMDLIYKIGARISLSKEALANFADQSADCGAPHIRCDHSYHWIVLERGKEIEHRQTPVLDDLLYWAFEATTFALAVKYELQHRNLAEDNRRIMWRYQLDLLQKLYPAWRDRLEQKIDNILKDHPYRDRRYVG